MLGDRYRARHIAGDPAILCHQWSQCGLRRIERKHLLRGDGNPGGNLCLVDFRERIDHRLHDRSFRFGDCRKRRIVHTSGDNYRSRERMQQHMFEDRDGQRESGLQHHEQWTLLSEFLKSTLRSRWDGKLQLVRIWQWFDRRKQLEPVRYYCSRLRLQYKLYAHAEDHR